MCLEINLWYFCEYCYVLFMSTFRTVNKNLIVQSTILGDSSKPSCSAASLVRLFWNKKYKFRTWNRIHSTSLGSGFINTYKGLRKPYKMFIIYLLFWLHYNYKCSVNFCNTWKDSINFWIIIELLHFLRDRKKTFTCFKTFTFSMKTKNPKHKTRAEKYYWTLSFILLPYFPLTQLLILNGKVRPSILLL